MDPNSPSLAPNETNDKSFVFGSESVVGEQDSSVSTMAVSPKSSVVEVPTVRESSEVEASPIGDHKSQVPQSFVPSLGAWSKPPIIIPDVVTSDTPTSLVALCSPNTKKDSGKPPPEVKADGSLRFPWAAKMDPSIRNLYRTTSPSYMEDGTPKVHIPNHVLMQGLANQKEYVIGQFYRCYTPSGGLIHAVTNRLWGRKCKIFTRKLGESSYLFHIPDKSTRDWVLQRGLWHIDDCIMFVAPWTPAATLALPEISTVPVWVTLKNIPSRLYSFEAISWIASGLGEPMVTNKPWLDPTQMGEAKLMVEVELDKGFPERIAAEDKRGNVSLVDVEYSWLPSKCKKCGLLGHKESRCLLRSETVSAQSGTHVPVVFAQSASAFVDQSAPAFVAAQSTPAFVDQPSSDVVATNIIHPDAVKFNGNATIGISSASSHGASLGNDSLVGSLDAALPVEAVPVSMPTDSTTLGTTNSLSHLVDIEVVDALSPSTFLTTPIVGKTFPSSCQPSSETTLTLGSNQFAVLDEGVYAGFEIGDSSSQKTRGGRTVKPTQKFQDMHWTVVGGRGNRGRGGRGGRGAPPH